EVALVELDVHLQAEVVEALDGVSADGCDAACHEEVAGAADDREVPRGVAHEVGAHEVERALVRRGVEHDGEAEPGGQRLLLIIEVEPLRACRRLLPGQGQRLPHCHGVVEHHQRAEVGAVLPVGRGQRRRLGGRRRGRVRRVVAVVEDVVVVERHVHARLIGAVGDHPRQAVGGARHAEQKNHDGDGQRQLGRCHEALHCSQRNCSEESTS
uniref:Uncharacterized protein n=1 Tax=Triticum urartu TaxID=4572 RepID=A0A8R7PBF0_TRIUA